MYVDYDDPPCGDGRTGSMLMISDVERGAIAEVWSQKYSKETLSGLFGRLQEIHRDGKLNLETMVPVFKEYGLRK